MRHLPNNGNLEIGIDLGKFRIPVIRWRTVAQVPTLGLRSAQRFLIGHWPSAVFDR